MKWWWKNGNCRIVVFVNVTIQYRICHWDNMTRIYTSMSSLFQLMVSCRSRLPAVMVLTNFSNNVPVSATVGVTYWGRDNMAVISQTIFSHAFSWNESVWISINISLKFVPKGQINHIPALVQATSHYLNQSLYDYRRIYASLGLNELNITFINSWIMCTYKSR